MRILLLLICGMLVLSSCARYQYATIASSNMSLTDNQDFVAENDTLLIRYSFNGRNAPVRLWIQNKLDVPVYIDWRQSALIVNDKAISYVPNQVPVVGAIEASGTNWNRSFSSTTASLGAVATLPASMDFIPPHSHITKQPMGLTNRPVRGIPDSIVKHIRVPAGEGGTYLVKQSSFSETSSPIRFRSYLTVSVGEAGAKPAVYEHSFYVSDLQTTSLNPSNFGFNLQQRGNRYFIREQTGFGKAATGFGVVAGVAVISGAAAALHPQNCTCATCHRY